jgi:hypothetical protein
MPVFRLDTLGTSQEEISMNRFVAGILTGVSLLAVTVLVSAPGVAKGAGPEQRQISDPSREQGLNLGFAEVSGAFLGAVAVIVQDRSGAELVNTVVDGPWFFVPLPAGSYNVKAIFDDQEKQIKDVRLAKDKVTMMVMYWDLNVPPTQMMARVGDSEPARAG